MSVEIMEGRGVLVDRTNIDRDSLMEIRMGNVSFDQIEQECQDLKEKGNKAYSQNDNLPLSECSWNWNYGGHNSDIKNIFSILHLFNYVLMYKHLLYI